MPFLLATLVLGDLGDVIFKELGYSLEEFFQTLRVSFILSVYTFVGCIETVFQICLELHLLTCSKYSSIFIERFELFL